MVELMAIVTAGTSLRVYPGLSLLTLNLRLRRKTNLRFTQEGAMLAELFMLRMEAIARSIDPKGTKSSDSRFVPIKLSTPVTKNSPTTNTKNG
jgi:hypothetical protein